MGVSLVTVQEIMEPPVDDNDKYYRYYQYCLASEKFYRIRMKSVYERIFDENGYQMLPSEKEIEVNYIFLPNAPAINIRTRIYSLKPAGAPE